MKNINITISFEDEKLSALTYFMGKENGTPQKALEEDLVKLYEKYVPEQTREYIESKFPAAQKDKLKRPAKPAAPKQPAPAPVQKPQTAAPELPASVIKEEK